MRLPVIGNISTKDGATNKNARLTNMLAEQKKNGTTLATVRPGLNGLATSSGDGNGLVCFGGELVNIYGDTINAMTDTQTYSLYTEDWSAVGSGNIYHLIKYGNGVFIAVPAAGSSTKKFYKSTDGIAWDLIDVTYPYNVNWRNLIWDGTRFLAISFQGPTVPVYATSVNGDDWTFGETSGLPQNVLTINSIAWNGTKYCMAAGGYAYVSSDGITWSENTVDYGVANIFQYASNGSIFCGAHFTSSSGGTNKIYTSEDGITWTLRATPVSAQWFSITYGAGKFCVTSYGTGVLKTATSSDGITWESGEIPDYVLLGEWQVSYGGGKFVAVKNQYTSSKVAVSSDGLSWNLVTLANADKWALISTDGDSFFLSSSVNDSVDKITFESSYELTAIGTVTDNHFDFALIP